MAPADKRRRPGTGDCFPGLGTAALLAVICTLVMPRLAAAAPFTYAWDLREIAAMGSGRVQLRDKRGRTLKTVDTSQMRYLYTVKTSLEKVAETQAELLIVDGAAPNAFAGQLEDKKNIIGINFAMLDVVGMDVHAAAALIGHELAHLRLEHGDKRQSRSTTLGIMKALGGAALEGLGVPGGQEISNLTFTSIETKYSRDQERQADYLGAVWAIEAGYEPDGAVRLHQAIHERSQSSPVPFLATHPSGPERIATLKSMSERLSR